MVGRILNYLQGLWSITGSDE